MKVFISQPMKDKTEEQILSERNEAIDNLKAMYPEEEFEVIDSYLGDEYSPEGNRPLWCLGKSLELLATADAAYFAHGWLNARGCRLEHQCCQEYGIKIL